MYSSLDRGVRLLGFAIVLTGATAELFSTFLVLLVDILLSVLLCSLAVGKPVWQLDSQGYAFERSLQDIALLSVARGVLLSVARGWDRCHPFARAYLWTSYIAFGACAPALITKAVLFQYTGAKKFSSTVLDASILMSLQGRSFSLLPCSNCIRQSGVTSGMSSAWSAGRPLVCTSCTH